MTTKNNPISAFPQNDTCMPDLWAACLIAAAFILRAVFAWFSLANLPATADEATIALMAKMIAHGDFPLLFMGQPRLFPVESYLMAPLIEWLPRNAFGARYQTLLQGLLSLAGFLLIVRNAYPPGKRWPAAVLILFPSTYLLMLTSAYAPPHYPMEITLAWISIYILLKWRQNRNSPLLVLIGFLCGLGLSNYLLSVTISAGVFMLIVFDGSSLRKIRILFLFAAGFLVGMIPYLLAIWLIPGAYGSLHAAVPFDRIISTMQHTLFTNTFARAMGVNPPVFPDMSVQRFHWPAIFQLIFAAGYLVLLTYVVAERVRTFYRSIAARLWPELELIDLAVIATLLTFGVFATHRTMASDYRYLLPSVMFFPFLVAHVFGKSKDRWKTIITGTVIILAIFNGAASLEMIKYWSRPALVEKYSDTPAIGGLLNELRSRGITHCYASFWLAYRITFESDEKILCAPVFNERFLFWPVPYKSEVDNKSDAVYILTQTHWARLPALVFQTDLEKAGISYKLTKLTSAGDISFHIYSDFDYPPANSEQILGPETYTLATNGSNENDLASLRDGDLGTGWDSPIIKGRTQWLEAIFSEPQHVSSITLYHPRDKTEFPKAIRILGKEKREGKDEWREISKSTALAYSRIGFRNRHPVYGLLPQRIQFQPTTVTALRIEVPKTEINARWGFTEMEIATQTSDANSVDHNSAIESLTTGARDETAQ